MTTWPLMFLRSLGTLAARLGDEEPNDGKKVPYIAMDAWSSDAGTKATTRLEDKDSARESRLCWNIEPKATRRGGVRVLRILKLCEAINQIDCDKAICHSRDTLTKLAKLQPSCIKNSKIIIRISAGKQCQDVLSAAIVLMKGVVGRLLGYAKRERRPNYNPGRELGSYTQIPQRSGDPSRDLSGGVPDSEGWRPDTKGERLIQRVKGVHVLGPSINTLT
ncbi:hypothetical protein CONLIGDRAFT_641409 [Coniochaeta ligniaria NRRL 30616]|uniref:Uncharacterized protein n=1 Tax=Coniochaeta ligniaria NRRL 30616 TaxID=1408157 RepID=A0A1J7IWQ4_9PEZI|nr:hypothetical protein CONLIGDRAFT_641409 [Coniochaeta ligniaria NRRL 30616]